MKLAELQKVTKQPSFPTSPAEQQNIITRLRERGYNPVTVYQELEMSAGRVEAHHDSTFSNATVSLHSHSFYEILYCCNTCGVEYLVGAQRYRLQKGDIIWVSPGVSHRPLLPSNTAEPYHRDVMWISKSFMDIMVRNFGSTIPPMQIRSGLLRTADTDWEFLGDFIHNSVLEFDQKKPGWEAVVVGNTMLLFSNLLRCAMNTPLPMYAETPDLLDQVMHYVEMHYAERLTLADTAKQFYVSGSTISNLFRQKMGASFYRCVTQRRLIAAKDLISRGVALETINEQVGFNDYSTFYRAFKQEYGISPREFKKIQESGASRSPGYRDREGVKSTVSD